MLCLICLFNEKDSCGMASSVSVTIELKLSAMKSKSSWHDGAAEPARIDGMIQVKCFNGQVGLLGFGFSEVVEAM